MTRVLCRAALVAAALAASSSAQERPSEEELFGTPPTAAPQPRGAAGRTAVPAPAGSPGEGTPAPAAEPQRPEEAELFGSQGPPSALPPPPQGIIPGEKEDPLALGGQVYLRLQASAYEDAPPHDWPLSSPNLVDLYLDVRPNDRVRGFVLGRTFYDPTDGESASVPGATAGGAETSTPGISSGSAEPSVVLDQLWVNFDLWRTVFVTAGKQHVKWGVGKFWNPTDYLHPVRRDPLAVFDVREGTPMVKLHLPWEKRGWNLYGVMFLEDVAGQHRPTDRVGRIAGGGRAELVLGTAELGLDALLQDGRDPRFGVDLSGGLGDFDLYVEAALRRGIDGSRWRPGTDPDDASGYVRDDPKGFTPQVVAGGSWSAKYSDEDAITLGAEYFYNEAGYEDRGIYPFLLSGAPKIDLADPDNPVVTVRDPAAFRAFYLGKHYAGAYASLPSPGRWNDTTFTLTLLGNLSDRSFVLRLDHSVLVLTYLRVETYLAGHLGTRGGEFRLTLPAYLAALAGLPSGAPIIDAGVAVRVSL